MANNYRDRGDTDSHEKVARVMTKGNGSERIDDIKETTPREHVSRNVSKHDMSSSKRNGGGNE